jgi:hypothetical protein
MATSTFGSKSYCGHVQDSVLSNQQLERRCPLDFGHRKPLSIESSPSPLESLPPEIAFDIFSALDIQSLFSLRRANKTLMAWVNSIPEYHQIIQHAPSTIRAILSLETASYITLHQLYRSLQSRTCHTCSLPASYISVLTGERLCPCCPSSRRKRRSMLMEEACKNLGLGPEHLNDVKRFRARPGTYGGCNDGPPEMTVALTHLKSSVRLFDTQECIEQAIKLHGSRMALKKYAEKQAQHIAKKWKAQYHFSCFYNASFPLSLLRGDPPPHDRLFMHIVVAPWITAGGIAWEVPCRHCHFSAHDIRY